MNWISDSFSEVALIAQSVPEEVLVVTSVTEDTELNGTAKFQYVETTDSCIKSNATFYRIQRSMNGLVFNCTPSNPSRSGATVTFFVVG